MSSLVRITGRKEFAIPENGGSGVRGRRNRKTVSGSKQGSCSGSAKTSTDVRRSGALLVLPVVVRIPTIHSMPSLTAGAASFLLRTDSSLRSKQVGKAIDEHSSVASIVMSLLFPMSCSSVWGQGILFRGALYFQMYLSFAKVQDCESGLRIPQEQLSLSVSSRGKSSQPTRKNGLWEACLARIQMEKQQ